MHRVCAAVSKLRSPGIQSSVWHVTASTVKRTQEVHIRPMQCSQHQLWTCQILTDTLKCTLSLDPRSAAVSRSGNGSVATADVHCSRGPWSSRAKRLYSKPVSWMHRRRKEDQGESYPHKRDQGKIIIRNCYHTRLELLAPTSELYTKDRAYFVKPIEGAAQFEGAAPPPPPLPSAAAPWANKYLTRCAINE